MTRTDPRRYPATFSGMAILLALLSPSCGSSDDEAAPRTDPAPSTSEGSESTEVPAPLEAGDICERLDASAVGAALGLTIHEATPSTMSTPQCSYAYTTSSGTSSNVTVAAMRPDGDLGGRLGSEAFDYVLRLNQQIAGGTGVDQADVAAGDRAVRLSGASLHLGIVRVGGRVVTVIVPSGDAGKPAVETLITRVAEALR